MNSRENTILAMVIVAILITGFDLQREFNKRRGDTITEVIRDWYRKWSAVGIAITFLAGFIAGHWFWCPDPGEVCK